MGGICAGIQLEKQLGIKSYTIFDENEDFGGTWLKNKVKKINDFSHRLLI
jgi:cation diffusion facilitator CzcD-associated flavoprotein CzcO